MLGLDCTRTKALTRSAMGESDAGSRISSQGMDAASATPVATSTRRSANCWRTANQMACVSRVAARTSRYSSSPRVRISASTCCTVTASTASLRCR